MAIGVKKKMIAVSAIFLAVVFLLGVFVKKSVPASTTPPQNITVVIDAGHGGLDGGTVGATTKVKESDLNLIYAKKLQKYLEAFGINVVQTRTTRDGLYGEVTNDYKLVDMKKRADIINGCGAQILISLHMNKFTQSNENGAQVFFEQDNNDSQNLANSIKDILTTNFDNARELALAGDYYILNNTNPIGVIVECGFLSNPTEEKLLCDDAYQDKLCYSIFCGIVNYLDIAKY